MILNDNNLSNALRFLSLDVVTNAKSGHPGICSGISDILTVLFKDFFVFNAKDPDWKFRDRFILSAGHGSAILYSYLYLTGYKDITLNDLKNFRKINNKTAGHPEYGHLNGVEVTTGPLGQGIANAVGFAFGLKMMASKNNQFKNIKIYCLAGDGCLMEGISQEALSFASLHNLDNLVIIFDNNNITIDGDVNLSTSENHTSRFQALNFQTIEIDGHNFNDIRHAFSLSKKSEKPFFINAKTKIGYGSSTEGTNQAHGNPFSIEILKNAKNNLKWNYDMFEIPQEIKLEWLNFDKRNIDFYNNTRDISFDNNPDIQKILEELQKYKMQIKEKENQESTRKSSGKILKLMTTIDKNIIGGSADLGESTCCVFDSMDSISNRSNFNGNYINYGIREHLMSSIMNGLAILGFLPYGGTFLTFSDYLKPGIRLSALMKLKIFYIFTHDSILLGEDGPTHQPIEHIVSLNAIPNLFCFRPSNLIEMIESYQVALKLDDAPSCFILSRQNISQINDIRIENKVQFGAYIMYENNSNVVPDIIIVSSGSEIEQSLIIAKKIKNQNIRLISMVCSKLFNAQANEYIESIMLYKNKNIKRIAIEAGSELLMRKYIGFDGLFIGINNEFGESGSYADLLKKYQLDVDNIENKIINFIKEI